MRVRGGLDLAAPSILNVAGNELFVQSQPPASFAFDHLYGPDATQPEVYNDVGAKVLAAAFEGYNGTIFAYGQTGSGKSHSIMGTPHDLGIVPRLAVELFQRVADAPAGASFEITATYAELYNEVISDLLTQGNSGLKIRQHVSSGIYVEDLTEVQVSSHEEIEKLLAEGNKARSVAATRMNERSSRSHAIFTIMLRQSLPEGDGAIRHLSAKVNLVDLAGSERADLSADAKQLQEGAAINKSLSALGNVINALTEGHAAATPASKGKGTARGKDKGGSKEASYIPYRSSKLTRLLEESLGGNTVTYMLATVSADERNVRETVATLKYAQRAKKITNVKSKNEAKEEKRKIRELTAEIERLNSLMEATTSSQPTGHMSSSSSGGSSGGGANAEQSAVAAELRMELEKARHEASLAASASLASAAKADELRAQLDSAHMSVEQIDGRLRKATGELTALQNAQRAAELDVQHARQELSQERLAHADEAQRAAGLQEELAAMRRQVQNAMRQASDAREEAAEAVAQRRAAERQLASAEAELSASRAGIERYQSEEEQQRRASTELLGAASRDKHAQAEFLDRNLAAFEKLLAQKDQQLNQSNDKLGDVREQLERRTHDVAELNAQLASRAAAYEELTERKAELLQDVRAAQADAQRWADEASRGTRRADTLENELGNANREGQLLHRRLEVKEVHVSQLMKENATLSEQLRESKEHVDTPESMLREMLRMTETELKLKSQLHVEAEAKSTARIRDLEKQLERFGVNVHAPAAKPMSFANFFAGLKFGVSNNKKDERDGGAMDDADAHPHTPTDGVHRRASFGRAAEARASFGRNTAAATASSEPRPRGQRPPLPPSAAGVGGSSDTPTTEAEVYRTPDVTRGSHPRGPHAAARRASFSLGSGGAPTPLDGAVEAVENAKYAAEENAKRAADAAKKTVDGLLKSTNTLFGSMMNLVDNKKGGGGGDELHRSTDERHRSTDERHRSTDEQWSRGERGHDRRQHHSAPLAQRKSWAREPASSDRRRAREYDEWSEQSDDEEEQHSASASEDEESEQGWALRRRRSHGRHSSSSQPAHHRTHHEPHARHHSASPPLPHPPHPVRVPGEASEGEAHGDDDDDDDDDDDAGPAAASWRSQLRRESFGKGVGGMVAIDSAGDATSTAATALPARRRPVARALPLGSPPSGAEDDGDITPSSAELSAERGPPEWAFEAPHDPSTYHHSSSGPRPRKAKRPPRGYHKPTPGPSPTSSPPSTTKRPPAWSGDAGHAKPAVRKSRKGSATPSPVGSPISRGKPARRVPSWPAGESASRRSSKGKAELAARLPRSVSFAHS